MEKYLKEFQSIGRPQRGPNWSKIFQIANESKSDRVMAFAYTLFATHKLGENKYPSENWSIPLTLKPGLGKSNWLSYHLMGKGFDMYTPEGIIHVDLKDINLTQNKTTNMKSFKNSFAVTGSIINLLRFEQELLKMGYGKRITVPDVFNYRGESKQPAKFITSGCHAEAPKGTYTPAMNDGASYMIFHIDDDRLFTEAVKYASELNPLFQTKDGVNIYSLNEKVYGLRPIEKGERIWNTNKVYRNHYIVTIHISAAASNRYTFFSSEAKAKEYIDKTVPLFKTEDGVDKFLDDTVYCVKPDLTIYFVRKGIDEKSPWPGYKYFQTNANAEKYVDENKPTYSKKQIRDAVNKSVKTKSYYVGPGLHKILVSAIDGGKLKENLGL